jgi:formate dehydrogenase subunit gamma
MAGSVGRTTAMTTQPDTVLASRGSIARFDRVERAAHWSTAVLFGILMATGAVLYAGPFSELFGRRELFRQVHVYAGLILPIPILVAVAGRWGAQLRNDLRRLNRWNHEDVRWFRRKNRARPGRLDLGKFNPGQKLNATFLAAAIVVMLATGLILRWPDPFTNDWRTGATFVHDWFAFGVWLAVTGHIFFALRDPTALHGMTRGTVTRYWARSERPAWFREMTDADSDNGLASRSPD